MSYLSPFNFTFAPAGASENFPGFSGGNNNRFNFAPPTTPTQDLIVPDSLSSYNDYYGNSGQNQAQAAPQPQAQPQRRRRPKNRANRNPQPLPQFYSYHQEFNTANAPVPHNYQYNAQHHQLGRVTPIQGPIFAKDGHLPVVPLYSYNAVKNGTLYQIPILWTALSYALGLEIRGEILRGLPCIKRLNQLFCPTAGTTYPLDHIERFIDENKALIKRMYGEFVMSDDIGGPSSAQGPGGNALRRSAREVYEDEVSEFFGNTKGAKLSQVFEPQNNSTEEGGHRRNVRQTVNPKNGGPTQQPKSNRVDSCESTVEITTPYWAANSAGKVRAIVNTQHFEQAIQQEVCSKSSTKRCSGDCGCEQKYKWHRLLAFDPDNECKGIFMDWFLFPSCCVCRCPP